MKSSAISPRLVIYGVGFVGQQLVRLADRKGWKIVAAYNRAGTKVGQDIGRLAGLDKDLGVIVENCDTADYSKLKADVVLNASHDSLEQNYPVYERFMRLGINVLCHGGEAYNPFWSNPEYAERIDKLANECGTTFAGSGIWDMTRLWSGMIVAGPCVEIDSLVHRSNTEVLKQGLSFIPFLGIGMTVEAYDEKVGRVPGSVNKLFEVPAVTVLQHYGYQISNIGRRQEPVVFDEDVYCPYQEKNMPAGVVVGNRIVIDVETEQGVSARTEVEHRVFRENEDEVMFWKVNGNPGMEITVKREDSDVASASSLFNRIPDVIRAQSGVHALTELGPLMPSTLL